MSDAGRMLCERLVEEPIAQGYLRALQVVARAGSKHHRVESPWRVSKRDASTHCGGVSTARCARKTYVASELEALTAPPPRHSWRYLLYCSPNKRAADFVRELADNLDTGSDEQDSALTLKGVALKLFRQLYSLVLCAFGRILCQRA